MLWLMSLVRGNYSILIRYGVIVAAIIVAFLYLRGHYINIGRDEVMAEWNKDKLAQQIAINKAMQEQIEKNESEKQRLNVINQEVTNGIRESYKKQTEKYLLAIDDIKRNGLLYKQATGIHSDKITGKTEANSPGGNNAEERARLPDKIATNLLELANDADNTAIQLGACQKWITDNGFLIEGQ